ncbi:MAG TPA: UDP-3-O-(3-hydroxymyristoyl)glucosamine N-acyltransferase [Blastocatellia bacterium]|jgi:UDP-3-O-[3-hydroxymyristoyl] glucosamine N-acyltransferase|nr:UDP-3-O-(3-hydroxymyristoyl)glucosamine N-acyltransferase [Blastocatellia bacterium]
MRTLGNLAELIDAELIGDPEAVVRQARPFDSALEGDITFASDAAYRAKIERSAASAIIIAPPAIDSARNLLVARNPKLAFARAVGLLHGKSYTPLGVSGDLAVGEGSVLGEDLSIFPRVTIGAGSIIGDRVTLHPGVVIGEGCRVNDDTVIHPNVTIYANCEIGSRVIIHAGAVIGADGFGFVPDEEGRQVKLLQLGRVIVEDDCEVGANCTIDRGGFGDTVLRRGVKLDNLVQVGHNTELGENTVVAALTGFSGGTIVGRNCIIAGQVGTNQHITIGDRATITGQAAVTRNVKPGAVIGGIIPAEDHRRWLHKQALYSRLPRLNERVARLEEIVRRIGQAKADEE